MSAEILLRSNKRENINRGSDRRDRDRRRDDDHEENIVTRDKRRRVNNDEDNIDASILILNENEDGGLAGLGWRYPCLLPGKLM